MQGIVFEYDPERSRQNRQFTVGLTDRIKEKGLWVKKGRDTVYQASDLPRINTRIIDSALFKTALESEMAFRKTEARFFSPEAEFTFLRIALHDLETFISRANRQQILCDRDGRPLGFTFEGGLSLELRADKVTEEFLLHAFLSNVETAGLAYLIRAKHVAGVLGSRILALHRDIPFSFFKSLPLNKRIDEYTFDCLKGDLSRYGSRIRLKLQEKKGNRVIGGSRGRARLDIDPSFTAANLSFLYPRGMSVAAEESRRVIYDFQQGIELHRNIEKEREDLALLTEVGAKYRKRTEGNWHLPASRLDQILRHLAANGFLLSVNQKPLTLDLHHAWETRTGKHRIRLSARITSGQDNAGPSVRPGVLFDAFKRKRRFLPLSDGSCGFISSGLMAELSDFSAMGVLGRKEIAFNNYDFPVISELLDASPDSRPDAAFEALLDLGKSSDPGKVSGRIKSFPVPNALNGTLRPYQRSGFDWLTALNQTGFNGILADDMGLGKTLQVLALLLFLKDHRDSGVSLIVVPKTLIHNWEIEIKRFAPSLSYLLHSGSTREKDPRGFQNKDLVITSYGLIRQDFASLQAVQWGYLILDEAQAIKNPDAKTTRAIKQLSSKNRLSLSGTPVENSPVDLWSHFDFLMPGMLGTLQEFRQRYHQGNPDSLDDLRVRTRPFILRRLKRQVCLELPSKTEITMVCPFTGEQKNHYDSILAKARRQLLGQEETEVHMTAHLLTLLLRLRQIACDPALVWTDESGPPPVSGKREMILETGEAILSQGHKILVFSQFVGHLKLIKQEFDGKHIKNFYLDGSTVDRKKEIQRFKEEKAPSVFFISLKAGGLGLNLTEANYAFLLDPWWNPAVENQAIDRCYRIGQENPVTVYRFITKDSIEEKVMALKAVKEEIHKAVIQESDAADIRLSREQLAQLLFD